MATKKFNLAALSLAVLFVACGDDSGNNSNNSEKMEVVSSIYNLGDCTESLDGDTVFVKDKKADYICLDGEWQPLEEDDDEDEVSSSSKGGKSSGKGSSSSKKDDEDSCSSSSSDNEEASSSSSSDNEVDSLASSSSQKNSSETKKDSVNIKDLTVTGLAQKGPFVNGSNIVLRELDGKTLVQTGKNFKGTVANDKGEYSLSGITLKSQYAHLEASGYYLNEITGEKTTGQIVLNALTDLSNRKKANINILTHLEYDRVLYLVEMGLAFNDAKKQAENEIFKAFHIDTLKFDSFEDLDAFGDSEAEAALLAISILLQGGRSVAELTELLKNISTDLSKDGKWDDDVKRTEIAAWAFEKEFLGKIADYRSNVDGWGFSTAMPDFEKFVHQFWYGEMGKCSDVNDGELGGLPYRNAFFVMKCENGVWNTRALRDSRDDQTYRVIKIGDQVWMAENLNFKTNSSFCAENKESNCTKYGRYYTWVAAIDSAALYDDGNGVTCGFAEVCTLPAKVQGVCPPGWHLPTKAEWDTLLAEVGGISTAGKMLKSQVDWNDQDGNMYNGTDMYGFSALPAGQGGNIGYNASFWSASQGDDGYYYRYHAYYMTLFHDSENARLEAFNKDYERSVRCLQD